MTELRSANVGLKAELEAARQERDMARDAVRLQAISFAVPRDVPGPVREVAQNIDYYRRGSTGRDPLRRQVTQLTLAAKLGADVTREFEWEKRLASHCTWTATEYYCLLGVLANIITLSERESLTPNSSLFTEALTRELANTLTLVSGLHNMARKGEWARVTATLMRTGVVDNLHLARTLQTLPPRIASLLMKTWETMDREVSAVQFSARRNEVSEGQLD